jgi:hypothetical protein
MAMRDWQFRREFLRGAAGLVIPMAVITASRGATSPFAPGRFAPVHFLPHLLGLLLVTTCQFLAYTNHHRARWIFLTVPASGLRGVVRGTYWAIWGLLIGLPLAIVLVFGVSAWGLTDAALFVIYSMAAASLYLGAGFWLIGGLPFSKPPNPARSSAAFGVMFWFLLMAGVLAVLQRLVIFRNVWIVFLSTGLFAVAAWIAARGSFRLLEARILTAVSRERSPQPPMFAGSGD